MLKKITTSFIIIGKSALLLPLFFGGYMKEFLNNYSYSAVKMFVNQFAISIFGAVLSMATTAIENNTLSIVVGICAIVFYLFLIYTLTWEIGAKDRISVDIKKKKKNVHIGLLIALLANVPNMLIALAYSIGYPYMGAHEWAGNMCAVVRLFSLLLQGMYVGVTSSITLGSQTLNFYPLTYVVIILPALVISWIAYMFGFNNKRFTSLFTYQDPTKTNKK